MDEDPCAVLVLTEIECEEPLKSIPQPCCSPAVLISLPRCLAASTSKYQVLDESIKVTASRLIVAKIKFNKRFL